VTNIHVCVSSVPKVTLTCGVYANFNQHCQTWQKPVKFTAKQCFVRKRRI